MIGRTKEEKENIRWGEKKRKRVGNKRRGRKRGKEKAALLKEMTPSWFTEHLHWAAVPLCLMLSGCQHHSQQHCLDAPRGSCVGLCSRLTRPLIRIDTRQGLSQPKSRSNRRRTWRSAVIMWSFRELLSKSDARFYIQARCCQILLLHSNSNSLLRWFWLIHRGILIAIAFIFLGWISKCVCQEDVKAGMHLHLEEFDTLCWDCESTRVSLIF